MIPKGPKLYRRKFSVVSVDGSTSFLGEAGVWIVMKGSGARGGKSADAGGGEEVIFGKSAKGEGGNLRHRAFDRKGCWHWDEARVRGEDKASQEDRCS